MQTDLIRVAVLGPESSGKTTLCEELALHYKTVWVPEYAREYIANLGRPYTKEDILHCAEMQIETEKQLEIKADKFIFSDTELIIAKVWLLDLYGECPQWIDKKIIEKKYDLYLLTSPDLPFIPDNVRENPHRRRYFFDWYKRELEERKFNYEIIEGTGPSRLKISIDKIESLFE